MNAYLKSGVHAVAVGADLALLDVTTDAYLCLVGGADAFDSPLRGVIRPGAIADTLDAEGLLRATPATDRCDLPSLPTRSIIHTPASSMAGLSALPAALGVVADLRAAGRGKGLAAYLRVGDSSRPLSRDPETVVQAARQFWDIGVWLPVEGECLVRSAMLVAFLRRRGLAADWVFGVRLWPFAAHCWVQSEAVCLNDDVERLWAYTPIYCR